MKRFPVFFVLTLFIFFVFCSAFADPEQITLTKQSKYNYINVDGYGFYKKCEDYSSFVMVLNNDSKDPNTITFPENVSITGWYGTSHPIKNMTYMIMDYGSNYWWDESRPTPSFNGTITMPGHSSYAFFFDITGISQYNLYWNTDVFFKLNISGNGKSIEFPIQGVIAQHGNGCPANEVCSAAIQEGGYNSDGGDGRIVVNVRNDMRDSTTVSALKDLEVAWTDPAGTKQSQKFTDAITWNEPSKALKSGSQHTFTGTFTLPVEIAVNPSLEVTAFFKHPSSLFFGNFQGTTTLQQRGGAHGILEGTYSALTGDGQFLAKLTNHQDTPLTVELPAFGTVKTSKGDENVSIRWNHDTVFKLNAEEVLQLNGLLSFADTRAAAADKSMTLSARFDYTHDNGDKDTFSAAGNLTREAVSDAAIRSASFCRDISQNGYDISFKYALNNPSPIDIPVQLATTLAVDGVTINPSITYTGCESGSESCLDRLSKPSNFILKAGETVTLIGKATASPAADQNASVRTSLLYSPENETKALYVGQASATCGAIGSPEILPTESVSPTPTETESSISGSAEAASEPLSPETTVDAPLVIPDQEETEIPVAAEEAPIEAPTSEESEALPTEATSEPLSPETTVEAPLVIPDQEETEIPVAPTATEEAPMEAPISEEPAALPTETFAVPTTEIPYEAISTEVSVLPTEILPTMTPSTNRPSLSIVGHNGTFGKCKDSHDVNFSFTLTNNGTGTALFSLASLQFTDADSGAQLNGIQFTSCRSQSAGDANHNCEAELQTDLHEILPGVSMTIGAIYTPESALDTEAFRIHATSAQGPSLNFQIEAFPDGNSCKAPVSPLLNDGGEALSFAFEDGKLVITLTLNNFSNESIVITPQTIYLHTAAITEYEGIVLIIPLSQKALFPEGNDIAPGRAFILPGNSMAELTLQLPLNVLPADFNGGVLNWNLQAGDTVFNLTGTAPSFASASIQPSATVSAPVSPALPTVPSASAGLNPSPLSPAEYYDLGELPPTGFSARRPIQAELKTPHVNFTDTALHLEIPVLDVRSDIVIVPNKEDGTWDIDQLGKRSAILSGAAKPGEGTSMIAAHNSLDLMEVGPFVFLMNLEENDRIFLTDQDDHLSKYRVYRNELTEDTDANQIYTKAIPGSLVLVTCESELPEGGYAYHRLVYAEPIG